MKKILILLFLMSYSNLNSQKDYICNLESSDLNFAKRTTRINFKKNLNSSISIKENDNKFSIIENSTQEVIIDNLLLVIPTFDGNIVVENEKHKWGIISDKGSTVIDVKYDDLFCNLIGPPFHCVVKSNNKWGILDSLNKIVLPIQYEIIRIVNPTNAIIQKDSQRFIFDFKNSKVIEIEDFCIQFFNLDNGSQAFKIKKNEKIGLMSKEGKVIADPIYDDIKMLISKRTECESLYTLELDRLKGLINQCGKIISPVENIRISNLKRDKDEEALIELKKHHRSHIVYNGVKSTKSFDEVKYIRNKDLPIIITTSLNKSGLYNYKSNEVVIEPSYDEIKQLGQTNLFVANKNGKFGLLSPKGKILLDFSYDIAPKIFSHSHDYSEFKVKVRIDGLYGVLDDKLNFLVQPKYHFIGRSYNERLRVMNSYKWGYLDDSLNEVIGLKYDYAEIFSYREAKVVLKGKEIQIDTTGNCIKNCND